MFENCYNASFDGCNAPFGDCTFVYHTKLIRHLVGSVGGGVSLKYPEYIISLDLAYVKNITYDENKNIVKLFTEEQKVKIFDAYNNNEILAYDLPIAVLGVNCQKVAEAFKYIIVPYRKNHLILQKFAEKSWLNEMNTIESHPPKAGFGHAKGIMSYNNEKKQGIPVTLIPIDCSETAMPKINTGDQGNWNAYNLKPCTYCAVVFLEKYRRMVEYPKDAVVFLEKYRRMVEHSKDFVKKNCKEVKEGKITDFGECTY